MVRTTRKKKLERWWIESKKKGWKKVRGTLRR
jgi:hypothetical protein